jgi:hypothetical protein
MPRSTTKSLEPMQSRMAVPFSWSASICSDQLNLLPRAIQAYTEIERGIIPVGFNFFMIIGAGGL